MSVPFSNTKLRVPQGFQTLLESLTREILRENPENIYDFAATYIENLIDAQASGKTNFSVKQSQIEDRYYNNHAFNGSYEVNSEANDAAATTIQSHFRGHQAREDVLENNEQNEELAEDEDVAEAGNEAEGAVEE